MFILHIHTIQHSLTIDDPREKRVIMFIKMCIAPPCNNAAEIHR